MGFSQNWEAAYSGNTQASLWPWTDVISWHYRTVARAEPRTTRLKVFELGCGAGANIPFYISLGADYWAVDGSPSVIGHLKEAYPQLNDRLFCADFTKDLGVRETGFDVVLDRAALTCNTFVDVLKCMEMVRPRIRSGGYFMGIHWFSDANSYALAGQPLGGEDRTREGYDSGPFKGIEPAHFFTEQELRDLLPRWEFLALERVDRLDRLNLGSGLDVVNHSMWNFVAQKP